MSNTNNNFSEYLTKFIETKNKLSELEKRHEKYRRLIEEYMNKNEISNISHNIDDISYNIKKTLSSRQTLSKKDVPQDIWNRYCKTSSFSVISVSKDK